MAEFNEEKARKVIESRVKDVKRKDVEELLRKEEAVREKMKKGPLSKYIEEVKIFISLLKDFINGEYKDVPWFTIAAITVALLYVLNPLDVIPDVIPIIGQIDDAFVLAVCLMMVEEDIIAYKEWKDSKGKTV